MAFFWGGGSCKFATFCNNSLFMEPLTYGRTGSGHRHEVGSPLWAPVSRWGSSNSVRLSMWLAQSFSTSEWQSWTLNPDVYPGVPAVLPSDLWIWASQSHQPLATPRDFLLLTTRSILRPRPTAAPRTSALALNWGRPWQSPGKLYKNVDCRVPLLRILL